MLIIFLISKLSFFKSRPLIVALPLVGLICVDNIFIRVVFPAPFNPNNAKHSYSLISKLTLSTAVNLLYFLVNSSILIIIVLLISCVKYGLSKV